MIALTSRISTPTFLACLVLGWSGLNASGQELATDFSAKARAIQLPEKPFAYTLPKLPQHFDGPIETHDNTPTNNPITNHGATLGRVLFYDKSLSVNRKTACASCHQQKFAFTDPAARSVGFDGRQVDRNSMSLVNVRFYRSGKMFWDERANTLEEQVLMPIENEIEMGHDLDQLVSQLQSDPIYPGLFDLAFAEPVVTKNRISRALAQFIRSIVSYRSKFDVGLAQAESVHDPFPNFTDQENLGKTQFFGRGKCASCHLEQRPIDGELQQVALFQMFAPAANGIDSDIPGKDTGLGGHTHRESDRGKFKVPSLRNVELTGPYMHDGRFKFIEEVLEQYNWSVRPHPNLDPRLQDFAENGMALPQVEKEALAAFLLTLTDRELIKDPKFADPFVRVD